jgi:competence protein ComEC
MRPGNAIEILTETEQQLEVVALEDARECKGGGQAVMVECRGAVAGKLMMFLPGGVAPEEPVKSWDRLAVRASIRELSENNPGYASWLRNQGVFASAQAREVVVTGKEDHWLSPLADMRRELKSIIVKLVPGRETGGLAVAMLVGDRSGLDRGMREDFSRAGLAHILAISGLHVGIVFLFLSKILGFIAVTPGGARLRSLLVIGLLIAYLLLTGAGPAVCRAVMMLSLMEGGKLIFRRHNSLNLLAVSALLQLLANPLLLFNPGFQLSYSAVAGILVVGPRLEQQIRKSFPRLGRKLAGSLSVCLAAQLCTAPLVAFHFHQFPTYFLLSNMLLLPVVSVAVVLGFSGMLLIWVPGLGQVLFGMLDFVLWVIAWLSGQIAGLPGAVVEKISLSDPGLLICLVLTGGLAAALYRRELGKAVVRSRGLRFPDLKALRPGSMQIKRMAGVAAAGILVIATLVVS